MAKSAAAPRRAKAPVGTTRRKAATGRKKAAAKALLRAAPKKAPRKPAVRRRTAKGSPRSRAPAGGRGEGGGQPSGSSPGPPAALQPARRSLRARLLEDGESLCCCFLMSGSPVVAEIVARVFPVVLVDCEHGSGGMGMDLLHLLQAVRSGGAEALVRVPRLTNVDVTRALDGGAAGVVVPLVESAEEARAALAAARYPPEGRRGTAPMCIRASGWGLDSHYAARADAEALVLAQVETTTAMDESTLEGILASGVDGVFLGPADLAASAGHLGDVDHPKVFALRERLEKACAARGVLLAGFAAGRRVSAADMLHKRGYKLVASAVDVVMLKDAALSNLQASTAAAAGGSARGRRRRPTAGY